MYARITLLELDPLRFDVAAALERFQELVLPELREQHGYEGVYLLASPEGKGVVITLWASEEDAESALATASTPRSSRSSSRSSARRPGGRATRSCSPRRPSSPATAER